MKRKLKIIAIALITAAAASVTSIGVFSWFENRVDVGLNDNITGVANGAYFADGDGSSNHPFIINTPRHMYNLAWLQYLGYFNNNRVGPETGPVYFALDPTMSEPLNMAGLAIPPIGTTTFPFVGYFNGNNQTISNLKVDNVVDKTSNNHINKTPSAIKETDAVITGGVLRESIGGPTSFSNTKVVNVMGMFGQTDTLNSGDTAKHIYDFTLDSATISSSSSQLLVGIAAGYLDSKMNNVTVRASSISLNNNPSIYDRDLTNSLSKYTLVGYATSSFITETQEKKTTAQAPIVTYQQTEPMSGSEYGASIPMKNIYNRLLSVQNSSDPVRYDEVWDGVIGENEEDSLTKKPISFYVNEARKTGQYDLLSHEEMDTNDETVASYTFAKRPDTNAFIYLYGEDTDNYTKQIDGIAYEDAINGGTEFVIGDGNGNWLTFAEANNGRIADGTYNVSATTNINSAQKWVYFQGQIRSSDIKGSHDEDSGWFGHITYNHYAYLELNATNVPIIVVGTEQNTYKGWTFDSQSYETEVPIEDEDGIITLVPQTITHRVVFATGSNESSVYLKYDNGWTTEVKLNDYRLMKVGEKYLSMQLISNTVTPSLTDDSDAATHWYSSSYGGYRFQLNGTWYMFVTTIKKVGERGAINAKVIIYGIDKDFAIIPESTFNSTLMFAYVPETHNSSLYLGTSFTIVTNAHLVWDSLIPHYEGDTTTYHYCLKISESGETIGAVVPNSAFSNASIFTLAKDNVDYAPFSLTFQTGSRSEATSWHSKPTYFPLSYAENGTDVSNKNTGYIISGSNYQNSSTYRGDIRVSDYTNNTGNRQLSNSLSGGYTYNNLTVITHEKGSGGGYVAVKDEFNSLNAVPTQLNGVTSTFKNPTGDNGLGLVRYEESRRQLDAQFRADFSHIHGLHFMDAQISENNTVSIPHAHILGETYSNYPMPQDCIDFNLKKNGFITFYAGTYFPGNTTFFSLHQIVRAADKSITSIKEISAIYDNTGENRRNKRYIYDYANNGGTSLDTSAGDVRGDMIFNMSWVTNPTMVENAVYYFEIPINSGEYALGSVSGKEGAYLMYLDIGTSQRVQDITTIEEDVLTESKLSSYVEGVDFGDANSGQTGVGGNSANLTIPAGTTGTLTYSYDSGTSTLTCNGSSGLSATHVGEGVTLSGATDGRAPGDSAHVETTTTITYDDFDETLTTTISKQTTVNSGTPTNTDTEEVEYNILPDDYETLVDIKEQDNEASLIRFRYWSNTNVATKLERKGDVYVVTFDTSDPLRIFVEELTPEDSDVPYTVIFKGRNETAGVTAVEGQYVTINSGA